VFGSDPIWVSEIGPVIGTYTGPGLVGVGGLPSRLLA
jgi:fatty acid-binding protein DegV